MGDSRKSDIQEITLKLQKFLFVTSSENKKELCGMIDKFIEKAVSV